MCNFNPHHHAGGDVDRYKDALYYAISIHTTTQVVTIPHTLIAWIRIISIHTTTQVVTLQSGYTVM